MYNERNENFNLKGIIAQILIVIIFILAIVWLVPSKNYFDKKFDSLVQDNFAVNLDSMKDAATSYFTNERLPQEVGDSETITLREMLDLKLLLPFTDKDGNQCDLTGSYVEITKMEDEYVMKVNLKCGSVEDFVIVHLGCYDYCEADICEEKEETKKPVTNKPTTPSKPTNPTNPTDPKDPEDPKDELLYEYLKTTAAKETYTAWSDWSDDKVAETSKIDVETKTQKFSYIDYERKIVKYTETVKPVEEKVQVDTVVTKSCTNWVTNKSETIEYGNDWVKTNTVSLNFTPKDSENVRYIRVANSTRDYFNCTDDCKSTGSTYNVYERRRTVIITDQTACGNYELKQTPIYATRITAEVVKTPVYGNVAVVKTRDVKYYRSRELKVTPGTTDTKWSESSNDKTLLNSGYEKTGNTKVK